MMEKRNFVTSARTPEAGAADIDEVLAEGAKAFKTHSCLKSANSFEKKASAEDEKTDKV